eukprot:Phypoly_transcript_19293.p1 GENE.Phypoly_transcript_19293~~Phypoly_transcript_19293.p1  ORF type:complete len:125 (+),score=10.38 Phypoly_transcript_19293:72-446(+)
MYTAGYARFACCWIKRIERDDKEMHAQLASLWQTACNLRSKWKEISNLVYHATYDEESQKTIDCTISECWRIKATDKSMLANPTLFQHLVSLPMVLRQLKQDMIGSPKTSYKFLEAIGSTHDCF